MEPRTLTIPPRIAHLVNPDVLRDIAQRIAVREQAEAESPYRYQRYLEAHAGHIMDRLRAHGNNATESDDSATKAA